MSQPPAVPVPRLEQSTDGIGGTFTEIVVSGDCDEDLFAYVAVVLQERLHGTFSKKATGLDEAYWDLQVNGAKIVVHLQVYLGISIHPHGLSRASRENQDLLLQACPLIQPV